MIQTFSFIEKRVKNSHLTILTGDKEKAIQLLGKYNVVNYTVDYVPLSEVDSIIKKFKYGFLIREDDVVNRVATPTKMSSYLAMGVIPIYTNVVSDFNKNIDLKEYSIVLQHDQDTKEWSEAILDFEKNAGVDPAKFYSYCETVFSDYYCREKYLKGLIDILSDLKI